jgi:hypothetical protein
MLPPRPHVEVNRGVEPSYNSESAKEAIEGQGLSHGVPHLDGSERTHPGHTAGSTTLRDLDRVNRTLPDVIHRLLYRKTGAYRMKEVNLFEFSLFGFDHKVTPHTNRRYLTSFTKCLFLISLLPCSDNDRKAIDVAAAYRATTAIFPRTTIMVENLFLPITIRMTTGGTQEGVKRMAEEAARQRLQEFMTLCAIEEHEVITTRDLAEKIAPTDFHVNIYRIESLCRRNQRFQELMEKFAQSYVNRLKKRNQLAIDEDEAIAECVRYGHQEAAVHITFSEIGYLVNVYLGPELPFMAAIMNRQIDGAPLSGVNLTNIALHKHYPRSQAV